MNPSRDLAVNHTDEKLSTYRLPAGESNTAAPEKMLARLATSRLLACLGKRFHHAKQFGEALVEPFVLGGANGV